MGELATSADPQILSCMVHSTKTQIRDSDPNRRRGSPATLRLTAIPWETVSVVLLRQGALKVMVSLPTNGFVYSIWPDE